MSNWRHGVRCKAVSHLDGPQTLDLAADNPSRRNIPQWLPFKQPYQSLGSAENVSLTPLPPTGGSSLPSTSIFSPDRISDTSYTPNPLASTPQPLLSKSPSRSTIALPKVRHGGWKRSTQIALVCAAVVLVTNIGLTIGVSTTGMKMGGG